MNDAMSGTTSLRRPRLGCDSGVTYSRTSDSTITRRRYTGDMHRMLHDAHLRADGRGIDYSGVAQNLDVMKVIDRRLYNPIISQLERAVETGKGANAALAEARRTKLTKHHPELSGLVEDVRRIH